jgi:hypothetical protein
LRRQEKWGLEKKLRKNGILQNRGIDGTKELVLPFSQYRFCPQERRRSDPPVQRSRKMLESFVLALGIYASIMLAAWCGRALSRTPSRR